MIRLGARKSSDRPGSPVGDNPRPRGESLQQGATTTSTTSTGIILPRRNRDAGNVVKSQGPSGESCPHVPPGPSETPQACIAGIREFIRDASDDELTFAAWCALGLSVIHEVEAAHG